MALTPKAAAALSPQYAPQGGGGPCGCVIVGGGAAFTLLIYDATKKHLCQAPIGADFKLTVGFKGFGDWGRGEVLRQWRRQWRGDTYTKPQPRRN